MAAVWADIPNVQAVQQCVWTIIDGFIVDKGLVPGRQEDAEVECCVTVLVFTLIPNCDYCTCAGVFDVARERFDEC